MNEADGQIDRKLGKPPCIVLDALVRIGADIPALLELKYAGAAVKPFVQQIEGDGLAEAYLQHFVQPSLGNAEAKQDAHDDKEHLELMKKIEKSFWPIAS